MNITAQLSGNFSVQKAGEVNDTVPLAFTDSSVATERFDTEYTVPASPTGVDIEIALATISIIRHICIVAEADIHIKLNGTENSAIQGRVFTFMNSNLASVHLTNPDTAHAVKVRVIIAGN